jgi:hypothetical protein
MNAKLEDFNDKYVVVPNFKDGGFGFMTIDRGDMTDEEWKTWNDVRSTPEVKEIINKAKNSADIARAVATMLDGKGITVCLTNQARPSI